MSNQRDALLGSLLLYCKINLHVSGALYAHHQEYIKLSHSHWYKSFISVT